MAFAYAGEGWGLGTDFLREPYYLPIYLQSQTPPDPECPGPWLPALGAAAVGFLLLLGMLLALLAVGHAYAGAF